MATSTSTSGIVGLVLVSHSRKLAEGAVELAQEMGLGQVPLVAAGGDVDGGLGVSYERIEAAVKAADQGAGVVIIADVGSSVLTARIYAEDAEEAALEGAEIEGATGEGEEATGGPRVVVADAPLVEGAVAAASAAATGVDVDAVVAAAEEAYGFRKL